MFKYTIEQFYMLYCFNKRLTIFIYKDFKSLSINQFKKIDDNVSFMLNGAEYVKQGTNVMRLN